MHVVRVVKPMLHVLSVLVAMVIPVMLGVFDSVQTDTSLDHYAEKPWPVISQLLPWLPMPANTIVNLAYPISGIYWIIWTWLPRQSKGRTQPVLSEQDVYMMYVLAWIGILYTPVQLSRLLLLRHRCAVLDQWYTLPGFAWALVWARYLVTGWSPVAMVTITVVSTLSYCLSLFVSLGFDIALAIHIILVIKTCWNVQQLYGNAESKSSFLKALLCCGGFVFLKLGDPYFPNVHPIFSYLSGHFWSKVCDALQIYFVADFFYILTTEKSRNIHK